MILKRVRGSAMISALMVTVVLATLALAIIALTMNNLTASQTDALNNDAYYAAEAGVNSGIEQLKFETSQYYNQMISHATSPSYFALFDNFFEVIKGNAQTDFSEPFIKGATTATTFEIGGYDNVQDATEYLVSCTSTAADGAQYVVSGKMTVKRVDVRTIEPYNWISDGAAVKAGGVLDLGGKNSVTVSGGDILVGDLLYTSANPPYTIDGGDLIIDPTVGLTIQDKLEYTSYYTPAVGSAVNYTVSQTISNTVVTLPITADPNVDLHFANLKAAQAIPAGIIYVKGNISLNNVECYADIYCDGVVNISNGSQIYGKIYCRGNVSITNSNLQIGSNIICDGTVNFDNGTNKSENIFALGGINVHNATSGDPSNTNCGNMFSPAPIIVEASNVYSGIVYSKDTLTLGFSNNMNAIFFSGGDIDFTGDIIIEGMVIAKEDIAFLNDANKDLIVEYYYSYSEGVLQDIINNNEFFFNAPGASKINGDIFFNKSVTPGGRVS